MNKIYIRNLFPENMYPIKGEIHLFNKEKNININASATIFYADKLSLDIGIKQDEFIVENFNIKDYYPCSEEYDCEVIDITTGQEIKVKQLEFKASDYPFPEYYNFSFKFKTYDYKDSYNIHKHKIKEDVEAHIIITGKCKASMDITIGTETSIKQSFYPIYFYNDNNKSEFVTIEYQENKNE